MIECGNRAMMPMKMISEMPLPMPRSVICSPSHIMNIVPAVRKMTVLMVNAEPLHLQRHDRRALDGQAGAAGRSRPSACRAATTTVP